MAKSELKLPVIQNWSCHSCSGCCREHLIEITEEEKRRIEKQGWTPADLQTSIPPVRRHGRNSWRLSHTADGACVFLDPDGLCRIHARFGEPAKPLACQVYPYAFHPAGRNQLAVSLRFSCPSVVRNLGTPVTEQHSQLRSLAKNVVGKDRRKFTPPLIHRQAPHGAQQTDWPDFLQFIDALDRSLADSDVHFVVRLMRTLSWLDLVEQSQFQTVKGQKLTELLELLTDAARKAQPDNDLPLHRPGRLARMMFRLMAAQMARHDTETDLRGGLGTRLKLANAALRFATGMGTVPRLRESLSVINAFGSAGSVDRPQQVRFRDLERPFNGRGAEFDDVMCRYFRVKIQGIHFCGPGHYGSTLVDGFRALALMYPIVMWLGRLRAAEQGRKQLTLVDVQAALATADHNFGYSPALGTKAALNRISQLSRLQQITALVGWYSQ